MENGSVAWMNQKHFNVLAQNDKRKPPPDGEEPVRGRVFHRMRKSTSRKLHQYTLCKFDRPLPWGSRQRTVKTEWREICHWYSAKKCSKKRQNIATRPPSTELFGMLSRFQGYVGNYFGKLRGRTQKPLFAHFWQHPDTE